MHDFIAEVAEAGIENARNLIKGLDAACKWINDNGPADLIRNGVEIQQKFVWAGGHFGLEAVRDHLEEYPDFIRNGGKYQHPKDFYEEIKGLLEMSNEEAARESASTYRLWKWVQNFFDESGIAPDDLEPSLLNYSEVQKGKIGETIITEEQSIRNEDQQRRDMAGICQIELSDRRKTSPDAAMNFALGDAFLLLTCEPCPRPIFSARRSLRRKPHPYRRQCHSHSS